MERNQFTFYRSFLEACKALPKKDQLSFLLAVCEYALNGEETALRGTPAAAFLLVKPVLDTARRRAAGGKNKPEADQEQSKPEASQGQASSKPVVSQTQASGNKREKEIEIEIEKEKEIEIEKEKKREDESLFPPPGVWGAELTDALRDWARYKKERRQGYTPTGRASLLSEVREQVDRCGEKPVAELLRRCMAAGWSGIIWEKLAVPARGSPEDVDWMKAYL